MARPRKKGMEYFPLDADIFEDDKLFDVQNEYGPLGEVIYIRLLCLVYKNGYYYRFDSMDKLAAMMIKSIGNRWVRDKKTVTEVILYLAKINLLSAELMRENVITSRGIQARYLKANERTLSRIDEYNLLEKNETQEGVINAPKNEVSATETPVFAAEIPVNATETHTESKVKESKINFTTTVTAREHSAPAAAEKTDNERETLVALYGENIVSDYERRFNAWAAKKERVNVRMYPTISKWIKQDNPMTKPEREPQSRNPFINAVLGNGGDFYE